MGFRFREFSWHVASLSPLLTTRGFLNELIAFLKKKKFEGSSRLHSFSCIYRRGFNTFNFVFGTFVVRVGYLGCKYGDVYLIKLL